MKKIIAIIFILLGVLIILYPKISNIIEEKNQTEVIKEYQNKIEKTNDEEKNKAYKKANKYNEMLSVGEENFYNEYNDILNLENDGVMAYIEIPKISVYLPIYHGTESEVLKKRNRSFTKYFAASWRKYYTYSFDWPYRIHKV